MIKTITLTLFILIFPTFGKSITPNFKLTTDSSYTISYDFVTDLDNKSVLELYFYFEHITKFIKKWNLSLNLLDKSDTTNTISLRYNYIIATLGLDITRILNINDGFVKFHSSNYYRTSKLLPLVYSSTGGVWVDSINGRTSVHYESSSVLNGKIGNTYAKIIQREIKLNIKDFIKYINLTIKNRNEEKYGFQSKQ